MSKKGARKTGGGPGLKNAANAAMAARMKQNKVQRNTMNCPICHRSVANGSVPHSGCGGKRS